MNIEDYRRNTQRELQYRVQARGDPRHADPYKQAEYIKQLDVFNDALHAWKKSQKHIDKRKGLLETVVETIRRTGSTPYLIQEAESIRAVTDELLIINRSLKQRLDHQRYLLDVLDPSRRTRP
jgi:hypothetical protein